MVLLLNTSKGNRQIENNGNLIFLFNKDFQKGYQFTGGPSSRIDTLSISNICYAVIQLGFSLCQKPLNNLRIIIGFIPN